MSLSKIQSESINLADNFAFTGTVSGAGKIGQVVQTVKKDTYNTNSSSFALITGLSVNITPTSTSSKILIKTSISFGGVQNVYAYAKILRGSTDIFIGDAGSTNQIRCTFPMTTVDHSSSPYKAYVSNSEFLDSPSTSSEITYSVHLRSQASNTVYINRESNNDDNDYNGRYTSSITAMEVLA